MTIFLRPTITAFLCLLMALSITRFSIAEDASFILKLYFNIIATDKIAAIGLANPLPEISGADP